MSWKNSVAACRSIGRCRVDRRRGGRVSPTPVPPAALRTEHQFCEIYRQWAGRLRPSMRQVHRAGEKTFIDFSGKRPALVDPRTGDVRRVELFVAVLGASSFTYAEAPPPPPERSLDGFDFAFNRKINRALVFELATARFVAQREDALLLGPPGTGKSHLAQAIGRAAIQQGYRVIYREAHAFLEELAEATLAETRKDYLAELTRVPLLIIDDLGMRKLPHTAAEDLLELIMRRYKRASTLLTSNRPVEDWGKLLAQVYRAPRKAPFLSGCESRPATVAPAGSSRSGWWR